MSIFLMDQSEEKICISNYHLITTGKKRFKLNLRMRTLWIFTLVHTNFFSSSLNHLTHCRGSPSWRTSNALYSQSEAQGYRKVLEISGDELEFIKFIKGQCLVQLNDKKWSVEILWEPCGVNSPLTFRRSWI